MKFPTTTNQKLATTFNFFHLSFHFSIAEKRNKKPSLRIFILKNYGLFSHRFQTVALFGSFEAQFHLVF